MRTKSTRLPVASPDLRLVWPSTLSSCLCLSLACSAAAPPPTPPPAPDGRAALVARLDDALASRDPVKLLPLLARETWIGAGNPDLATLEPWLPTPPITRDTPLSETELLYKDGEGRSWRAVLVNSGDPPRLRVLARARACPPAPMRHRPLNEEAGPDKKASAEAPPKTFTALECWPLPK